MTVRFLFLFLEIEIEVGLSDRVEYDVAGYRYLKLIQDTKFETSFSLVSFRGRWWETMRGMEHDGNYTGFTLSGFGVVIQCLQVCN